MKLIPILYSKQMVQAKLAERKHMTRRMNGLDEINECPDNWKYRGVLAGQPTVHVFAKIFRGVWVETKHIKCPYGQPGDILWTRENFKVQEVQRFFSTEWENNICIDYVASEGTTECRRWIKMFEKDKPKVYRRRHPTKVFVTPNIHMPYTACRMWDKITSIRAERIQVISEADAIAEGIESEFINGETGYFNYEQGYPVLFRSPIESFKSLWKSINGEESWNANRWVWVNEFEKTGNPERTN